MNYDSLPLHHFSKDILSVLKSKNPRGVLFGNFGACNTGDEAILKGELRELKKLKKLQLSIISRYPENVTTIHRTSSISLFSLTPVLRSIFSADFIIMGGGGLFCKNDTGLRGLLFQLYTTALILYLPLLLRKPVFVLGIGFYPNANTLITRLACFAFRFVQRLTVRDQISYAFLKSKHLPVVIYKDMSFLMPLMKKKTQKKYNKSFVVGLALNKPHDTLGTKKVIEEVAKFMIELHKTTHFTLYALDYHPSYYNDLSFADEIIQHTSPYAISYDVVTSSSPDTVFSSFQSLHFMIASRLHASIFSHRLRIPFYAVSYDKKCESFLKSINHNFALPYKVTEKEMSKAFKHTLKKNQPKKESTISESTRIYQGATL